MQKRYHNKNRYKMYVAKKIAGVNVFFSLFLYVLCDAISSMKISFEVLFPGALRTIFFKKMVLLSASCMSSEPFCHI